MLHIHSSRPAIFGSAVVTLMALVLTLSGASPAPSLDKPVSQALQALVPPGAQRSLVPAYFYPSEADVSGINWWPRMCIEERGGSIAIMNPGDGPGAAFDQNYKDAIDLCHGQDWRVIGYVKSGWGARSEKQVREDIAKYRSWYPSLDGIFVDEMENNPGSLAWGCWDVPLIGCLNVPTNAKDYYSSVYEKVKDWGADKQVVGNPGNASEQGPWQLDTPAADIVSVIERGAVVPSSEESYREWVQPQWVYEAGYAKIAHMVYNVVPPESIPATLQLTRERNAGWVYVTDKDNSWRTLPTIW
ncbi:spherulation-specific family 4 protein [Arthrobacter oryzae]|uniref:spherulation-specific family 4 protein n=1 Tax=Arthrobacter oryzae TaxID=409290 RepID=UPI00277FCF9B|nr:spherulation-specific family 4 protein [Arthrobacter oryzae]MDQ0078271.1 hypothetical protein [Arthrobacter oryzae]